MNFQEAENKFKLLKSQNAEGQISEAELKSRLEDLMIQDDQGRWWMIGYETGLWYYNDGKDWLRADPPQTQPARPSPPPVSAPAHPPIITRTAQTATKPSYWLAILAHLCFGFGLFYVDKSIKRKWLYPAMAFLTVFLLIIYGIVISIYSSSTTAFGYSIICLFYLALLIWIGGFLDVLLTCRSRRAKIS
jgi:hypothetical protein